MDGKQEMGEAGVVSNERAREIEALKKQAYIGAEVGSASTYP
jgi:hypothetical protein